ncbi:MAG: hypothetical protein GC179_09075 [Anaerolineaceae bacterium]|nr:hypothetical protein [Anaerolineaceae bacterium]
MTDIFDIEQFQKRLVEVISWCNIRIQSSEKENKSPNILRSVISQPERPLAYVSPKERDEFIDRVFAERPDLLHNFAETLNLQHADSSKGRLLAFFPYLNVNDGVAEIESKGYFDYGGYPPWDTWVYYIRAEDDAKSEVAHLIAWVPSLFLDNANDGIRFSPDNSLVWLKDSNLGFSYIKSLAQANLLV